MSTVFDPDMLFISKSRWENNKMEFLDCLFTYFHTMRKHGLHDVVWTTQWKNYYGIILN